MRKLTLLMMWLLSCTIAFAQGMSDQQVMQFIQQEVKAGTSQSQIVTKLMQKGVKIEQIRRIRQQYDKQLKSRGASGAADAAVSAADSRMRSNGTGKKAQEVVVGTEGTSQAQLQEEADIQYAEIQQNINRNDRPAVPEARPVQKPGQIVQQDRAEKQRNVVQIPEGVEDQTGDGQQYILIPAAEREPVQQKDRGQKTEEENRRAEYQTIFLLPLRMIKIV